MEYKKNIVNNVTYKVSYITGSEWRRTSLGYQIIPKRALTSDVKCVSLVGRCISEIRTNQSFDMQQQSTFINCFQSLLYVERCFFLVSASTRVQILSGLMNFTLMTIMPNV